MNRFEDRLNNKIEEVNEIIGQYIPAEEGYAATIFSAMNYSISAGGKRIRPIIMKAVYEMLGGEDEALIGPFMTAIEMIHTYSLVHDDLPAMDDDDYRRGKLTTHKKYGHAMGILAGDALLNYAYEVVLNNCKLDDGRVLDAMKVLAGKAGVYGMVGGQVVDVENNGKFVDEDMLIYVYENKTSALLQASLMVGGILAGADDAVIEGLSEVGRMLGMAFQIQDDILDETGDEEKIGKPVHSDEKNNKSTFVAIYGMEISKNKVEEYTTKAIEMTKKISGDSEFLVSLMSWMINREY
ncbi:polyprenyl synthetase family protein [Eubacterium xylanophilum]|uniref:polyprenyl synthetase family protein n=1 Tax=Eubacterium xylanophilum TaxID=39497 RepID=UPI000478D5DD|nr:farnesyl diphosphate synthase [Eubacterium xylanophilum]